MSRRTVVMVVGIVLMCWLTSMTAQANWTARLLPSPMHPDHTLEVMLSFKAEGHPGGHLTDLFFQIGNRTDSPVTILWNESELHPPNERWEHIRPLRYGGVDTTTTVVPAGSWIVERIKPARYPSESVEHWQRSIRVIQDSTLFLVLTVESPQGKHKEKWKWVFQFEEDQQVVETENDHTIWLTVALVAAVLLGIFVLLST